MPPLPAESPDGKSNFASWSGLPSPDDFFTAPSAIQDFKLEALRTSLASSPTAPTLSTDVCTGVCWRHLFLVGSTEHGLPKQFDFAGGDLGAASHTPVGHFRPLRACQCFVSGAASCSLAAPLAAWLPAGSLLGLLGLLGIPPGLRAGAGITPSFPFVSGYHCLHPGSHHILMESHER